MLHSFIKKNPFPQQHCRTTFQYKLKLNDKPKLSNWFLYYIGKFHPDILIAFFKSNSTTLYMIDMIKMTAPILCSVNIKENKYRYTVLGTVSGLNIYCTTGFIKHQNV